MSLTLPVVGESGPVRDGARSLLNVYMGVMDVTDEIASTWAGLNTVYSAPEAPDVMDAMTQPGMCARTLAADADGVCAALLAYADRLDELKTLREQLAADIAAHETKAAAVSQGSLQSDDATAQQNQQNQQDLLSTEAMALEGRVARFIQALEEAQQECSSKIRATQISATHPGQNIAGLTGVGLSWRCRPLPPSPTPGLGRSTEHVMVVSVPGRTTRNSMRAAAPWGWALRFPESRLLCPDPIRGSIQATVKGKGLALTRREERTSAITSSMKPRRLPHTEWPPSGPTLQGTYFTSSTILGNHST